MQRPNYEKLETAVKHEFRLLNVSLVCESCVWFSDRLLVERCWVKDRSRSGTQS